MSTIKKLSREEFPAQFSQIPDPPKELYLRGNLPPPDATLLCVVGSRAYTQYGKDVCEKLIMSLKDKNVWIISGLAIGIDTIAHKTAIKAGLKTLALPGSGLNQKVLYPSSNKKFAEEIIEHGGGLLSEFKPDYVSTTFAFPKRNRLMAALSKATLIIEAEKKSGTLITARCASDYNKDVLVIPGSIFSRNSEGPHLLMRIGATPITSPKDLHEALGFPVEMLESTEKNYDDCSSEEKKILQILQDPMPRDELMRLLDLPAHEVNILLSLLEMKGYIREDLGQLRLF